MSKLFKFIGFVTAFLIVTMHVKAQQVKAYETVYYHGENSKLTFKLSYADGYIAASKIILYQRKQKPQLFLPDSGVPEDNGELVLSTKDGKQKIILLHISDETSAPVNIKAIYRNNGKQIKVVFKN